MEVLVQLDWMTTSRLSLCNYHKSSAKKLEELRRSISYKDCLQTGEFDHKGVGDCKPKTRRVVSVPLELKSTMFVYDIQVNYTRLSPQLANTMS